MSREGRAPAEGPRTRGVPRVTVDEADGLDAYRVEHFLPAGLRLAEGEGALVVIRGASEGSVYVLGSDRLEIGRDRGDVALPHQTVSRCHAVVERADGAFWIADLGSLNGTYVNGAPVERARLSHGDQVQIGMFKLVFVSPAD